ncbi:hypothetical protein FBUS_03332 [Fasciolopsis buskii]|uniref:Uncharacterized protein n=1 Tax=Fasciolopsis buskii TaxID=27845 RepID=A0A8E0S5R4_9TREM|nr:hypothetical protein FBUS_03332 [Fasciolopsis buski]
MWVSYVACVGLVWFCGSEGPCGGMHERVQASKSFKTRLHYSTNPGFVNTAGVIENITVDDGRGGSGLQSLLSACPTQYLRSPPSAVIRPKPTSILPSNKMKKSVVTTRVSSMPSLINLINANQLTTSPIHISKSLSLSSLNELHMISSLHLETQTIATDEIQNYRADLVHPSDMQTCMFNSPQTRFGCSSYTDSASSNTHGTSDLYFLMRPTLVTPVSPSPCRCHTNPLNTQSLMQKSYPNRYFDWSGSPGLVTSNTIECQTKPQLPSLICPLFDQPHPTTSCHPGTCPNMSVRDSHSQNYNEIKNYPAEQRSHLATFVDYQQGSNQYSSWYQT